MVAARDGNDDETLRATAKCRGTAKLDTGRAANDNNNKRALDTNNQIRDIFQV